MNYIGLKIRCKGLGIVYIITLQNSDRCYVNNSKMSFFWTEEIEQIIYTNGKAFGSTYEILNPEILENNYINIF